MNTRLHLILILPALIISGCATGIMTERDRAMMAGRYGELEKHAEAEVPDLKTAKTAKLASLCFAYAKLKRYNKLDPCLDQLEKNVAAGDTNMVDIEAMQKQSPFLMGMAKLGSAASGVSLEQDVSPHMWEVRALASMDLGQYTRAIEYGKKMYAGIPKQWNLERYHRIHAVGVLGLAYALAGDRAAGLERAKELEAVSTSYPYTLLKTDKQVFLARIYIALGDYQRAYEVIREDDNSIFRSFADLVSGGSALEGGSLFAFQQLQRSFMLHKSELETGHLKEAGEGFDEMLKNPATPENGDLYWILLYDRGRIAERQGNGSEAVTFYKRAVEVIESQRSTLNTEASKIGFIGSRQSVYQDLVRLLVAQNSAGEAFEYVERSKARALVDMLAAKKDFAVAGDPEKVRTLLAMKESAEDQARLPDAGEGTKTRSLAVRARAQLVEQAPELASLVSVTSLTSDEIRKLLPPQETLIEYYYSEGSDVYAFVVTGAGVAVRTLDGKGLTAEVQAFRQAINEPARDSWRGPAQRLYARLVAPIEPLLGNGRQITVVAHGGLHYLPFNALHDGKQFLIERYALRVLPAASVMKFMKPSGADKPGTLLALGNPDLGDQKYDLTFAQAEAQAIAAAVPRSRALLRRDASETAFKQYATGFRFIHIASHGRFEPEAPLSSALLLSPDGGNDGLLTVGELYSMRIDADLVTLSACETGLGKIAGGDDVVGLMRGFLYAGTSAVVTSLWQVDDRATGRLMTSFYEALRGGAPTREALRRAQLASLGANPHPFFWAAFQLTGGT